MSTGIYSTKAIALRALAICVPLVAELRGLRDCPPNFRRKGREWPVYKKGAISKGKDWTKSSKHPFFRYPTGSFRVSNGERQERQSQTPSEGG